MQIFIDVRGQHMSARTVRTDLAPHSQEFIKFTFSMSTDWTGLKTFAQFRQNGLEKPINAYLDSENSVYVPSEITIGQFTVMLYGVDSDVKGTTNSIIFTMKDNHFVADAVKSELTESLYQQLIAEFKQYESSIQSKLEAASSASASASAAAESASAAKASEANASKSAASAAQSASAAKTSAEAASAHIKNTENPHKVTKAQVGLGNVDNTADADKSVKHAADSATVNGHTVNSDVPTDAKFTDTTYPAFAGATASADGSTGLVPKPTIADAGKYLCGDGTWKAVSGGTTTGTAATITIGTVTTGDAGTSASVTNSGTTSAAVFDFVIPKGDKGDKGDTGTTGATGADGKTPVRGTDYWTADDIATIETYCQNAILNGEW